MQPIVEKGNMRLMLSYKFRGRILSSA